MGSISIPCPLLGVMPVLSWISAILCAARDAGRSARCGSPPDRSRASAPRMHGPDFRTRCGASRVAYICIYVCIHGHTTYAHAHAPGPARHGSPSMHVQPTRARLRTQVPGRAAFSCVCARRRRGPACFSPLVRRDRRSIAPRRGRPALPFLPFPSRAWLRVSERVSSSVPPSPRAAVSNPRVVAATRFSTSGRARVMGVACVVCSRWVLGLCCDACCGARCWVLLPGLCAVCRGADRADPARDAHMRGPRVLCTAPPNAPQAAPSLAQPHAARAHETRRQGVHTCSAHAHNPVLPVPGKYIQHWHRVQTRTPPIRVEPHRTTSSPHQATARSTLPLHLHLHPALCSSSALFRAPRPTPTRVQPHVLRIRRWRIPPYLCTTISNMTSQGTRAVLTVSYK
ncbi:hypothetical protein JB92DRAFT_451682 [Gautieria morchelliformis]|nr:hypothetical protein JB92DRAFT_451682 [Gautieria morchelliformis]